MGEPITDTSLMRYSSETQLQEVEQLIKKADDTLKNSDIGMYVAGSAITGVVTGIGTGLAATGLVAPAALPIVAGVTALISAITNDITGKQLINKKLALYKEAVSKQNAIIKVLKEERIHDKESIANLTYVNQQLISAIEKLQYDLGIN